MALDARPQYRRSAEGDILVRTDGTAFRRSAPAAAASIVLLLEHQHQQQHPHHQQQQFRLSSCTAHHRRPVVGTVHETRRHRAGKGENVAAPLLEFVCSSSYFLLRINLSTILASDLFWSALGKVFIITTVVGGSLFP